MESVNTEQMNTLIPKRSLKWYQNRVKILQKKPQPEQKSPEWFRIRNTLITASEVASCLTMSKLSCENYVNTYSIPQFKYNDKKSTNPYENKVDYLIKKCKAFNGESVFSDNIYTLWGKKYEEVAVQLYQKIKSTKVHEFGLLIHPRLKWLGASPDGITTDGVMLEIKCPYSRKIKDTIPPIYYYYQVQIQLEVGLLDEADFLECEIKEFESFEEYSQYNKSDVPKGIVLERANGTFIYQDSSINKDPFLWANDILLENIESLIPHYYYIPKYNIINIKRDPDWFEKVKPELKKVHEEIKMYQNNSDKFQELLNTKNKKHIETINDSICTI